MRKRHVILIIAAVLLTSGRAWCEPSDIVLGDGRQPQVAVNAMGDVFVVHALDGTIWVSSSADAGKSFGDAVLVDKVPGLSLGRRRGPRIAATGDAVVVTAISGAKGGGKDGDVFAWVSRDQGKSWTRIGEPLNRVPGSAREGLHAMAAGAEGTLVCVWLDLRHASPGKPGTEVWCTTSSDGGKSWSPDRVVHRNPGGTVCECCHPSVVIDDKGAITVMFRNALAGARDMYLTVSKDGGRTFSKATKLGSGSWQLKGCPMDGGSLAVRADEIATVWRREATLYAAAPGQPEQPMAQGSQPVIAAVTEGFYSIWMEGRGLGFQSPGKPVGSLAKSGSYPALAAAPDGKGPVIAAWERDGKVVVRTIHPR